MGKMTSNNRYGDIVGAVPVLEDGRVDVRALRPGTRIYSRLRHVSRSGMTRAISFYVRTTGGAYVNIDDAIAAETGFKFNARHGGLTVTGAGMDMGFHVVYSLGMHVFGRDGYSCPGTDGRGRAARCPSNAHTNGAPLRRGARHRDGYYFEHSWRADD